MAQKTYESTQIKSAAQVTILPYHHRYQKQVLNLIENSDSTPRTVETWAPKTMTAVLAFDGNRLIGAIPLEKRKFSIGNGKTIQALWVSGAHVDPAYRSLGIGSAMDRKIQELFPQADAVFAFRPDETSRAYQWYERLGFENVMRIISFRKAISNFSHEVSYDIVESAKQIGEQGGNLLACYQKSMKGRGGSPVRTKDFWKEKLKHYYYKDWFRFSLLTLKHKGKLVGYALLGRTSQRDNIDRFEVLEWSVTASGPLNRELHNAIFHYAHLKRIQEVRIQLSAQDPEVQLVKTLGFKERWRTNMLGKPLKSLSFGKTALKKWRYFQIDYA